MFLNKVHDPVLTVAGDSAVIEMLKIDSRQAAAALEHPRSRQIVLEVVAEERSLQQLADATGLSLSLLHYHVTRLRRLGLVKITRKDRRAGRHVKRYRAMARRFLVPSRLATDAHADALARELRAGLETDRAACDETGVVYWIDAAGRHRMSRLPMERRSCAFEVWVTLFLTRRDAERLGRDIRSLLARYSRRPRRGARPVIAYSAFAPRAHASS